jgi:signal transduction histidine kinase/ActR/RegA family two-component response regulator
VHEDSERALILAPLGRDSAVAASMLAEAKIEAQPCADLPCLIAELQNGAGFAVVTEEALQGADLRSLSAFIEHQPEWSDFQFILLTFRGGGLERNPSARRFLDTLGNVAFLERPFHPTTLVSLAQAALRSRRRQYEAHAKLIALREAEADLRDLAAELERRVEERTREREEALQKLHEMRKLETIGQLTGGVAHDFNNLLMPILGNLEMLGRKFPDDPRSQRMIANALDAAERARTLISRLLAFARRQNLEALPVDIAALVRGIMDLMRRSLGPQIEINLDIADDLPAAIIDPNQFELALLNLAVNSRDAMPDGGQLVIAISLETLKKDSEDLKSGEYIRVTLTDTGSGMDEATLQRAIEPFYSTKGVGKGRGLGLSMVYGLAAQSGGTLRLRSRPGEGTTAELLLPATVRVAGAMKDSANEMPSRGRPLSILLVDDEELVRKGTAEMLADLGHSVTEAGSAAAAIALLGASEFDLIVTDYLMPRTNGLELVEDARSTRPGLAAIIITGFANLPKERAADLVLLPKPFRQAELARALAEAGVGENHLLDVEATRL